MYVRYIFIFDEAHKMYVNVTCVMHTRVYKWKDEDLELFWYLYILRYCQIILWCLLIGPVPFKHQGFLHRGFWKFTFIHMFHICFANKSLWSHLCDVLMMKHKVEAVLWRWKKTIKWGWLINDWSAILKLGLFIM